MNIYSEFTQLFKTVQPIGNGMYEVKPVDVIYQDQINDFCKKYNCQVAISKSKTMYLWIRKP